MATCYIGHKVFENQLGVDLMKNFGSLVKMSVNIFRMGSILQNNYYQTLKEVKIPKKSLYKYLKSVFSDPQKIYKC